MLSYERASLNFCADKRANYDACRSMKVSRVTRSLDPEGDEGPDRTIGKERREEAKGERVAEEEIRAKRNRNVASKRSHQSGGAST